MHVRENMEFVHKNDDCVNFVWIESYQYTFNEPCYVFHYIGAYQGY